MKMKKVLALVLTLGLGAFALAGCGGSGEKAATDAGSAAGSAPAAEASGDTVVVGTNPTFAPFEFQDDAGNMKGFDLDLMRAIGEEEGFEVEFKSLNFDALTAAVQNGEIDVIAAGMSITPERLEQLSFSKPYMDASLAIYVAADNEDIKSVDDLKDKKVASQSGTTGGDEVNKMAEEGVVGEAKILDDYNMCFLELSNGGADALIIDVPVAENYMAQHEGEVKMVGDPYAADFYGLACAKDNQELADKLSAGLQKVIENGTFEELCKKYELPVPSSIMDGTAKVEGLDA